MTAITTAARLLRVAADELKNAYTLGGDWGNEHEALDAYNEHMATATTLEHMARGCLAQIEEPAHTWPAGLLDRVKSALERIENNHCIRRIPADPTDPDLVLAEVRYLLEGETPPFWVSKLPQGAAPAAVARWGCEDRSAWFALAMGAAASLEDAANCLRDKDAQKAAMGAATHVRESCNKLWWAVPALEAPAAPAHEVLTTEQILSMDFRGTRDEALRFARVVERAVLAAAPQAPAAPSAVATQVIENLLQLARIVNTAVEDWGETKEDDSMEVIFHKEEVEKLDAILEFFDDLPDAPPEEGVIESGPLRAARVLRSQAAPAAPAVDAAGVLLTVIQRLNQNPYSLTKSECISEVEDMRDAAIAAQAAAKGEHDE